MIARLNMTSLGHQTLPVHLIDSDCHGCKLAPRGVVFRGRGESDSQLSGAPSATLAFRLKEGPWFDCVEDIPCRLPSANVHHHGARPGVHETLIDQAESLPAGVYGSIVARADEMTQLSEQIQLSGLSVKLLTVNTAGPVVVSLARRATIAPECVAARP